jgi:hypothetical protein
MLSDLLLSIKLGSLFSAYLEPFKGVSLTLDRGNKTCWKLQVIFRLEDTMNKGKRSIMLRCALENRPTTWS